MTSNYRAPPDPRAPGDSEAPNATEPDELVKLDATAQSLIGQQLSALYSELLNQEIPEHLRQLLRELEAKDRKS